MGKSALKTLNRVQKLALDEQRKILNALLTKEEQIEADLQRLIGEFEQEKEFARQNPCNSDFGAYAKVYLKKKEALENSLSALRAEIAKVRDIITEMFKEQKTYEIVDETREKRKQKEFELAEQKLLDEIGTNAYIKKHDKPKT